MKIVKKFKKSERGSITIMVLTAMLFMLVVITASYLAISNKCIGENKKISQISKQYQVTEDEKEREYREKLNNIEFLDIDQVQSISMFDKTTNTETADDYGNKIMIPAGFRITEDATDVTQGVVIEDKEENQFVWVPVGVVYTNEDQTESKEIKLGRYDFTQNDDGTITTSEYNGTNAEDTSENHNSEYGNAIAKDIEHFKISANGNCGYYIGRYEAGVEKYDESITTVNNNAETNWTGYTGDSINLVSKSGQQVWNLVTQNKASELSRNMYTSNKFVSDLINSYAWDTAVVFIQEFSGDVDYSMQTRFQSSLANTGNATDGTNFDVRCNIYDMAGNTVEWTTETVSNSLSYPCVDRGGSYYQDTFFTSKRSVGTTIDAYEDISFRPILYLNN